MSGLNMSRPCLWTWVLTIWHKKTMCFGFLFYLFFNLCPFEYWSNPRFDQDLNKFKTWKWKGKPGSFFSHSKMKLLGGSWNFQVWNPKPLLFMLYFIRQSLGLGVDIRDLSSLNMSRPCLSTLMLTIWHKKTICFGFLFSDFFFNFDAHLNLVKS